MARSASYTPVFRGHFPADARGRWAAIRGFFDQWCAAGGAATADPPDGGGLVEEIRCHCAGELSYAVESWLRLAERAGEVDTPEFRDCPVVGPVEDCFDAGTVTGATVILMAGEGDVFWAVANARLGEDDPPVEVYQKYDPSAPPLAGRTASVSEFAIKYLCMYNEVAAGCAEHFSADCADEEVQAARDWFGHALVLGSDDFWCGPLEVLEREGVAAIARGGRLVVSVFGDPAAVGLPPFLAAALERSREQRRRFGAS